MRVGTISSSAFQRSDLNPTGRMDAGFHLLLKSVQDDGSLSKVQATYSVDEAIELLKSMPAEYRKKATADLVTGDTASARERNVDRAIETYPHLALAAAFRDTDVVEFVERQAEKMQAQADQLRAARAKLGR